MNQQRSRYITISVGLFMLLGLAAFIIMAIQVSGFNQWTSAADTYEVVADFTNIGGLKVHAPVNISGVKIGEVKRIQLDPKEFNARVTLTLTRNIPIPYEDISARILTEGLLGSNYISIVPGFSDTDTNHPYLQAGDVIAKTQEAIILENLIGQLLFNIKK